MPGEAEGAALVALLASGIPKQVVETGCEMLKALLDEPLRMVGSAITDRVEFWRWKNQIQMLNKAQERLRQRGVPPKALPPAFLLPLLRAAGDTDDPTLQAMWANLLASGVADERNQHPSFVRVLAELSGADATVLVRLQEVLRTPLTGSKVEHRLSREELATSTKVNEHVVGLSLENLFRLGLCGREALKGMAMMPITIKDISYDLQDRNDQAARGPSLVLREGHRSDRIRITPYGQMLLEAIEEPTKEID